MSCFLRKFSKILIIFSLSVFALGAYGQEKNKNTSYEKEKKVKTKSKPVNHWAGSNVQLGLVINTGNTNSTNMSGGATIKYTNSPWLNIAEFNAQINRTNKETTKERYYASDQAQYSFSKARKNYVYANANVTSDRFSPYEFQVISSAGYGRDLIKSDKLTWSAQAGPGFRYDDIKNTKQDHKNLILYTQTNLDWKVSKTVHLTEQLQYTFGHPYNYLNSVTALTNKLTGNLSLQLSYTMQYYSQIPVGSASTKKLDTITNVAVVYNF